MAESLGAPSVRIALGVPTIPSVVVEDKSGGGGDALPIGISPANVEIATTTVNTTAMVNRFSFFIGFLLKDTVIDRWGQHSTAAHRPSELALEAGILALDRLGTYQRSRGDARIFARGREMLT